MPKLLNENYSLLISVLSRKKSSIDLGIDVFSYSVGAKYSILIEEIQLANFIDDLRNIYKTQTGRCELRKNEENCYISFQGTGSENVAISGEYFDRVNIGNQCKYHFEIDQAVLPELIHSFEVILEY